MLIRSMKIGESTKTLHKTSSTCFDFSESIQQAILSDSMLDACCIFKRLVTYHGCLIDQSSKCENVTTFLRQTILYWYKILKSKLSE